jgi:hypothetical protein
MPLSSPFNRFQKSLDSIMQRLFSFHPHDYRIKDSPLSVTADVWDVIPSSKTIALCPVFERYFWMVSLF